MEKLSEVNDNYELPLDHTRHEILGLIQTKGSSLILSNKYPHWSFDFRRELYKEFNYLFCYCMNKDKNKVERVYILPKEEIKKTGLSIYLNPDSVMGPFWYDKYKINDEIEMNKINDIWKEIIK